MEKLNNIHLPNDTYGLCPICKAVPTIRHVGRKDFYGCCDRHKLYWWIGHNLFGLEYELDEFFLKSHKQIYPFYFGYDYRHHITGGMYSDGFTDRLIKRMNSDDDPFFNH